MKNGGLNYPGIPRPFVGTWERQFGEGVSKKIEGFRFTNNKKQPIRQTITNIRSTSLKKPKFVKDEATIVILNVRRKVHSEKNPSPRWDLNPRPSVI